MNRIIPVFVFAFCVQPAFSQLRVADSATYPLAAQQAIATFQQAVSVQKEIYTGPEHFGYLPTIEGLPYLFTKEWLPGAVVYDGILYPDVRLKYDVVKDKLVLKRLDAFAIELRSEKISLFNLPQHTFIYLNNVNAIGLEPGFYERLSSGALTLLVKHKKRLEERIEENKYHQRFLDEATYYAIRGNRSVVVKNAGTVLNLVGNKKGEIQQALKKEGIKFKSNKEQALRFIADYYNTNQP